MKKIPYRYLIVCLTLLVACSSSDSGDPGANDDDGAGGNGPDRSANLLGIGDSANDLLSNDNYDRLVIEIDYVAGFRPSPTSMQAFQDFIERHTFKTEADITVTYRELPSPGETELSIQRIADLEAENRTAYNDGRTLAVYIYFADAASDSDDEDEGLVTLGAVYRNTSMVIYERTIRTLANQSTLISISDVEIATLNHEFGHLFGLVDLGTPMVNPHEDPEANSHCIVDGCLMRAQLEFGPSMMKELEARTSKGLVTIPELGPECQLDLENNGGRPATTARMR